MYSSRPHILKMNSDGCSPRVFMAVALFANIVLSNSKGVMFNDTLKVKVV